MEPPASGLARATRERHLFSAGPKRILSLDGGGVRGLISLGFLQRVEAILRQRSGRNDFRLADYFDLIGGTSTGSLIAALLSLGKPVQEVIALYLELADRGFRKQPWFGGFWAPKFDGNALRAVIRDVFGVTTLGSDEIRCGLGIVAKRLDTGSVWLFHNHPHGSYFSAANASPEFVSNREFLLADILRASTAAPTYFAPEFIQVSPSVKGLFVDGGVSPHNNPALSMLMLGTLTGYGFHWPLGADRLMLLSVGTGATPFKSTQQLLKRRPAVLLAIAALRSLMHDSDQLGQALLQWMSNSPTPWLIDGEVGNLAGDVIGEKSLLHYLRYDAPLARDWLVQELSLQLEQTEVESIGAMDRPENSARLLQIGQQAAARQVSAEHFPAHFDLNPADT